MPPAAASAIQDLVLPATIAGLWQRCALAPLRTRAAYEEAATLGGQLAVRRLNAAQREYFRELQGFVEAYEDEHDEEAATLARLQRLAAAGPQK